MLVIKWISQRGLWILLFNAHKSLLHLLMECASGYTSYPDLGKSKFRAHKAFSFRLPFTQGAVQSAQGMLHEGDDFALSCWLRQDHYPFSFSFFDLERKDRIQCQDVLFMVQILGEYLIFWFMEKLWQLPPAKNLARGVLWHHHYQKGVTVLSLFMFLVRFSISRHCDTYGTCQGEVTQFLSVAAVAIVFLNESNLELFS